MSTARDHGIDCDLVEQDSLFVGLGRGGLRQIEEEVGARQRLGYPVRRYDERELPSVIGSQSFTGGVRYGGTHGIDALRYAQGVKSVLLDAGVQIYESTEVRRIEDHKLITHSGSATAEQIIFCADKLTPRLTPYARNVYHAQTFLAVTEPLSDVEIARLFPERPLQCWDSDLVYSYWRLTGDGRLLLGGGSALTTFALHSVRSERVIGRVIERFKQRFPFLSRHEFIQYWPGMIDSTRDLFPTLVREEKSPWLQFVLGCVGLPWAAFCGDFAARHALDSVTEADAHYYDYFTPQRYFLMPLGAERLLGKPLVFSINNAWAKYRQVDKHRERGKAVLVGVAQSKGEPSPAADKTPAPSGRTAATASARTSSPPADRRGA